MISDEDRLKVKWWEVKLMNRNLKGRLSRAILSKPVIKIIVFTVNDKEKSLYIYTYWSVYEEKGLCSP